VTVGRIGKAHGLTGEVVVHPDTDHPDRFRPGARFRWSGGSLQARAVRESGSLLLVAFEGIDDRPAAEGLRGQELWILAGERRPLAVDEYWPDQLIGLEVRDQMGAVRGVVSGVDDSTPQHRIRVETPSGRYEVPLVRQLVTRVDTAEGYLVVAPIPGLLDPSGE
jgi:16S rRNA processing protein RimM